MHSNLYGGWIYANDHISLSMNINGNFRNKRKEHKNLRGVPSKLPISTLQGITIRDF